MNVLGIDIGGSGIKGAPVDLDRGDLITERFKVLTPKPSTPEAVTDAVRQVVEHFEWTGPVGITFPGVVVDGVTRSAANVDKSWIGFHAAETFSKTIDLPVTMLNDADAAGVAEMAFGAGKGHRGLALMLTFGTGIGSALFVDGTLVPNTELGHLELDGYDAEKRASSAVKDNEELSYPEWAERVERYLQHVEMLFSPTRIIIGGGISRKWDKFIPLLKGIQAEIVPADLRNNAGIVGAAMAAASAQRSAE
ncbi:polyphosphate--glucose phosphotransferase [Allostreptomyces psammosilenae]|uniref:Polyphosphate glucokinase n=1 Tax=Allostreptomyces psammosilenae TaxID=1892865 RepID=A0A853A0F1_9ACTN|nr:ROK family protein [Allostreptomyces psammosilenae]NYI08056.1 polyphosphate glucokinase [Allostreptomyces psammosilenae]